MYPSSSRHSYITRWLSLIVAYVLVAIANATLYNTSFTGVTWDNDDWVLETTQPDQGHYQSRANLANGYIGINVASIGPFFEVDEPADGDNINGWPLFDLRQTFATVSGFYDVQPTTNGTNYEWLNQLGGESVISGIPHWAGLAIESGGHVLDASTDLEQLSNFKSALDMKNGVLTWDYTWTPPGSCALNVSYAILLHKLYVNQAAVGLNVMAEEDTNVNVIDILEGDCAVRSFPVETRFDNDTGSIMSAVQPDNIPYVTAYVYSTLTASDMALGSRMRVTDPKYVGGNSSGIAQQVTLNLKANTMSTIAKYVGIASSDAFADPQATAMNASAKGCEAGFQGMYKTHAEQWQSILTPDSIDNFTDPNTGVLPSDPNIVEEQILAVTNPFFLLQNLVSPDAVEAAGNNTKLIEGSIAVGGLSSSSYAGLIFWDVEVWMSPGLTVAFPEQVSQISNYRLAKYPQAQRNIEEKFITSQNMTHFAPDAAIYPWTSGRFGNCTGTGPCFDYEYHINGDIALQLENYYIATGDVDAFKEMYYPIYHSVAQVYSDLSYHNESTGMYYLRNATDPDEYANMIDMPAYTQVLVKRTLNNANTYAQQLALPTNDSWTEQAGRVQIPTNADADIILEYEGMNGSIAVKQADVILIDDLLDYQNDYTLSDFTFYAGHQSLNGPGMTYGVFSIVASSLLPTGCPAYTYSLYSTRPYARAPFYQFSEQLTDDYATNGGTHPAYPFLTGIGGAYRVNVFGYLGLRLRGDSLNVDPNLPSQVPFLRYRIVYWKGYAVAAEGNYTSTTLRRVPEKDLKTADPEFAEVIPVTVGYDSTVLNLKADAPLVLRNRQTATHLTVPGNILQCAPSVTSNTTTLPGQFALSAVDGGITTSWRPANPNVTSTLTIDLGDDFPARRVTGLEFDWAQNPPVQVAVHFSNSSGMPEGAGAGAVYVRENVVVSKPYDAGRVDNLVPYQSNTTSVGLGDRVWNARYVMLSITGNQNTAGDGGGASVAEFAVVVAAW